MDLEHELQLALAPCSPVPAVRAAVLARVSARPRRGPGRTMLISAAVVAAAAAVMLAARLHDAPTRVVAAPAQVEVPDVVPPVATMSPLQKTIEPTRPPVVAQVQSDPVNSATRKFTVRLMPLQDQTTSAAASTAIHAYHAALRDALRTVPGLMLVDPSSMDPAVADAADFRLTVSGTGPLSGGIFATELQAETRGTNGRYRMQLTSALAGKIAPACADAATGCGGPSSMAEVEMKQLRNTLFPAQPFQQRDLQGQLLNASLPPVERLNALLGLGSFRDGRDSTEAGIGPNLGLLRDPQVVRGAIELAATATDPAYRAEVWRTMRGVGNPELVQPLVAALQLETESKVRVEAVATLAADFIGDPRAHTALEIAAVADPGPLVRALARRGLSGDDSWNKYVVASLEDTGLPAAQRIEALFFTVNQAGSAPSDLRQLLDDDAAVRAFTEVLPKAWSALPGGKTGTIVLLSRLGSLDHPAITDLLLDNLSSSDEPIFRQVLVTQLTARCADSRVRTALAKISVDDPDPQLRQLAARALSGATASADPLQSPTR